MTPAEFIAKWKNNKLSERAGYFQRRNPEISNISYFPWTLK